MEVQKIGDLIISGNGSTAGGTFRNVKLNGNGKIQGDTYCEVLECNGASKIEGNVKANSTVVNGSTKISGNLTSERVSFSGSSKVEGDLTFENLISKGASKVAGGVKGEKLLVEGTIAIGKDCEVEEANFQGGFTIDGLLNADKIFVSLHGKSYAKEIGGETIKVTKSNGTSLGLDKIFKVLSRDLTAEVIEGDIVELEYTKAKVVRGNTIKIGIGCEIELVEYKNELETNKSAKVIESRKID
ncbi:polymer-forming cytoskeletal protein [Anaerobacillus isosaccharinicus]|uniref:Polymer-forming cytoskeletal protein n=1 Tax=Anaerobacillus isosaccharinicus TaxID=1532552 RepID=A0A7S7L6W5_9BACI|nr:polymer-forming cytoskeletal protein [Anaerobacillus isosaccharinicus]MBA5586240.1 polymer-forming cytoskeletal protein [Anaerobacillus isosaccharinicus]QOY35505.1 polymer-forming cytoskeletal protein [Anaerobacillus isosaccharinicus]